MSETIVRHETQNLLGALRQERDRFVALAFSSADILCEGTDLQNELLLFNRLRAARCAILPWDLISVDGEPSPNIKGVTRCLLGSYN